ncbi:type II secretion system protein [Neptuniibacter sp. QD29_5]|uniref:type II secretion system protein n=1 Tax=Neptuniibacter sp. QD29_5 TaxID=3398207 RepID=UPI0039F4E782
MQRRCSGFSLLELTVSIFIITVLMASALQRLELLIEDVERVSFEGSRDNIQAQITLKVAYWFAEQQVVSPDEIAKQNPVDLIQHKPLNYAGELAFSELRNVAGEHWYFVTDKRWLVYKAKRTSNLKNEFMQADLIPYRVEVGLQDSKADKGLAIEAKLKPLYEFYWQAD